MKVKVGVFFGGVSVEHEVSVISALQAIQNIDEAKYEVVPIYITKDRKWYTGEALLDIDNYKNLKELLAKSTQVNLTVDDNGKAILQKYQIGMFGKKNIAEFDVAFPVIHGTFGEDGTLQGLFELYNIPYVGCDVGSSAVGMDKVMMKQILHASDVQITDYCWFYSNEWYEKGEELQARIEDIGYPVIVKPANLGSSVGISKAKNVQELQEAIDLAISFANKIVVEKVVSNLKEINCSVVGDYEHAEASVCEEVLGSDEILSYKDKYEGNASKNGGSKGMQSTNRKIPAEISEDMMKEIQNLAVRTFQTLGCGGVSRIDFLIDQEENKVYVNEINTIPGSLSFYLWEPVGKSFKQLTTELIQLGLKRHRERNKLTYTVDSNLFSLHGGSKGGKLGVKK